MHKKLLGDQAESGYVMFNTSFSYLVLETFERVRRDVKRAKDWSIRLDKLLAFTYSIAEHDVWMHDHELGWGGEVFLASLAKLWKQVLRQPDERLGLDGEYTRPGIMHMLKEFKSEVEEIDTCDDPPIVFDFEWTAEDEAKEQRRQRLEAQKKDAEKAEKADTARAPAQNQTSSAKRTPPASPASAGAAAPASPAASLPSSSPSSPSKCPTAAAPAFTIERRWCENCGTAPGKLICSKCKAVGYCGRACQKSNWKGAHVRAANGAGQPPHKMWCVAPSEVEEIAQGLTNLVAAPFFGPEDEEEEGEPCFFCFEALQDARLRNAPAVYHAACERHGLHAALLSQMRDEAARLRAGGTPGEFGASFTQLLCNTLFCGMYMTTECGERVFLRQGNSCTDETRVLGLLRSEPDAWLVWLEVLGAMVESHFRSPVSPSSTLESRSRIRDILVATIYGLSHESIATLVIDQHTAETWAALGRVITAIHGDEEGEDGDCPHDPGGVLEGYASALSALVREQAKTLRGKEWAYEAMPLTFLPTWTKWAMWWSMGRANALAYIEKKRSIQMADLQRFMERCQGEMEEPQPGEGPEILQDTPAAGGA